MATEPQVTAENRDAVDKEHVICPCCGKPTLIRPVKINDELLDHYMACIISGVPFSHTYPVYGGRMKVTVTQLDTDMIEHIRGAARALTTWGERIKSHADITQELNSLLNIYSCLSSITVTAGAEEKLFQPAAVVKDICERLINKRKQELENAEEQLSEEALVAFVRSQLEEINSKNTAASVPMPLLMGIVEAHNQIYNILLGAGFDVNFWEGIELA